MDFTPVLPILDALSREGGAFAIVALLVAVGAGLYALDRRAELARLRKDDIDDQKNYEAQLERERQNAENYQRMTDTILQVVDRNSAVIAQNTATIAENTTTTREMRAQFGELGEQFRSLADYVRDVIQNSESRYRERE